MSSARREDVNDISAMSAKTAVLERLRAVYGEDVRIIKQGQMYATSAPATHVGTTSPVATWVFEAETGEGKVMTLVASQIGEEWSVRKITSDPDDPAREL
jgi:hypothetical protein